MQNAATAKTIQMNLQAAPFYAIQSETKTIEMRLYDEKRQQLCVGDAIEFTNVETKERLICRIVALHRFENFRQLYAEFDKIALGYTQDETAHPDDMLAYYSEAQVAQYGVLGIEIQVK